MVAQPHIEKAVGHSGEGGVSIESAQNLQDFNRSNALLTSAAVDNRIRVLPVSGFIETHPQRGVCRFPFRYSDRFLDSNSPTMPCGQICDNDIHPTIDS